MKSALKSRQKTRRNFRKNTKSGGRRKYTYAYKKRRSARSRRRTKIRGGARSRRRTNMRGGSNKECNHNSEDKLILEKNCDGVEGDIEGVPIPAGQGYCSGKYCISEDSINGVIDRRNFGRNYTDPWTRKEYARNEIPEKFRPRLDAVPAQGQANVNAPSLFQPLPQQPFPSPGPPTGHGFLGPAPAARGQSQSVRNVGRWPRGMSPSQRLAAARLMREQGLSKVEAANRILHPLGTLDEPIIDPEI